MQFENRLYLAEHTFVNDDAIVARSLRDS